MTVGGGGRTTILLLCSRGDLAARAFAQRWATRGIVPVTCTDLSRPGWKLELSRGVAGVRHELQAAIDGRHIAGREIDAVITRLPFVTESELDRIHPDDRAYVAAEMQAFLFAFLSALCCPVVNRATPACLLGPNWRWPEWRRQAIRLDIPVVDCGISISPGTRCPTWAERLSSRAGPFASISVVGKHTVGDVAPELRIYALKLARAARLELLRVWFTSPDGSAHLAGCDLAPDLSSDEVGNCLIEHLESASC
jgi:hypothetical protein